MARKESLDPPQTIVGPYFSDFPGNEYKRVVYCTRSPGPRMFARYPYVIIKKTKKKTRACRLLYLNRSRALSLMTNEINARRTIRRAASFERNEISRGKNTVTVLNIRTSSRT